MSTLNHTVLDGKVIVAATLGYCSALVGATYGPKGKFVILTDGRKSVTTKDGVSVLRALSFDSQTESGVLEVIRDAALDTLEKAGDGTTSTIILANLIYGSFVQEDFMNKDKIVKDILKNIQSSSKNVAIGDEEIYRVALTSVAGDIHLARAVVDAYEYAQENNLKTVIAVPNNGGATFCEVGDSMSFSANVIDTIFYDNGKNTDMKNCKLVVASSEVSGESEIVQLVETCIENDVKDLVILAPKFAMNALAALSMNHKRVINIFPAVVDGGDAIKTKLSLESVAVSTGSSLVGVESGISIGDVSYGNMGSLSSFSAKGRNVSMEVDEIADEKKKAIADLKSSHIDTLSRAGTDEEREMIKYLIAILDKTVVKIMIGGSSDNSVIERKDRADDCINAIELALVGGVVLGGGEAYRSMAKGTTTETDIYAAGDGLYRMLGGSSNEALDPTIVVKTVVTQAIDLAFMLGNTASIVVSNRNGE